MYKLVFCQQTLSEKLLIVIILLVCNDRLNCNNFSNVVNYENIAWILCENVYNDGFTVV